jgi:hypothetical protein
MNHTFQLPTQIRDAAFYGDKTAFYAVSTPKTEPWQDGPPIFAAYTRVYLPHQTDIHQISKIIGNKGYNLIQITQQNQIHYIWFHQDGYFELWGDENNLPSAVSQLLTLIN